jgi:hypothetical protein
MRIGITGLAITAAVALSFAGIATPAAAASGGIAAKTSHQATNGDELSARRRHVRRYYRSGNAGAARAFGAIAGTIGGIVAADQARRYYYRPYSYGYSPYGGYGGYGGYGYGGYGGYGGGPYGYYGY